tara:strand:- start:377 stop:622 length:246 start_codon:yes stop_codon:yes gene_type:complete
MSRLIETTEDGWECVPHLKAAVQKIDNLKGLIYEIKNCIRDHDLDYIVEEMKQNLENAIECLEQIDTDVVYKTIQLWDEED